MPKIPDTTGKPFAEIGTLLRNLRLRHGYSQYDLAAAAGINNSYLSRIENGERRPSPKILKKFAELLNYPYDELVVKSGILSEDFVRTAPAREDDGGLSLTDQLRAAIGRVPAGRPGVQAGTRRGIPIFDSVPAGLLKEANVVETYADLEHIILTEDELGYDERAFALIVKGDSMVEAGILDGDMVIISPGTKVLPGDIGAVQVNRESTTLKLVWVDGDQVILQPANSSYKPMVYRYPDQVEILGKVILVRRKLL